jgi:hypothetical protein
VTIALPQGPTLECREESPGAQERRRSEGQLEAWNTCCEAQAWSTGDTYPECRNAIPYQERQKHRIVIQPCWLARHLRVAAPRSQLWAKPTTLATGHNLVDFLLATRRGQEYIPPLVSCPWHHGSISKVSDWTAQTRNYTDSKRCNPPENTAIASEIHRQRRI